MIVILGSQHDPVAVWLAKSWAGAELCTVVDLVSPGWSWQVAVKDQPTWVISGKIVPDKEVTGIFVLRSAVLPEELTTIHQDDRVFLSSELRAFITFLLASTRALVVNPIVNHTFGEDIMRREWWATFAQKAGVPVYSRRMTHLPNARPLPSIVWNVEVVGSETFSDAPLSICERARKTAEAAGLLWGVFSFDSRRNLLDIRTGKPASSAATKALHRILKRGKQ